MEEPFVTLVACKPLDPEYNHLKEIKVTSSNFTVGRGLDNSLQILSLTISRKHCKLIKNDNFWILEDYSTFGIMVNNKCVGKGNKEKLKHGDIIVLERSHSLVYKFLNEDEEFMPTSSKRMKLDTDSSNADFIKDMNERFNQSQNSEIKHLEEKINNTSQIKNTNYILLKNIIQTYMVRKMNVLNSKFVTKIENLTGEKDEIERQRILLVEERDAQLETLKQYSERTINELMEQIQKHSETETELFEENKSLYKKLEEERKEFLAELNRESSLKQNVIDKLQAKMKEKEEMRLKEKSEFMAILQKKTLELRLERDKELQEIKKERELKETYFTAELKNIKEKLQQQVEIAEKEKHEAQMQLTEQKKAFMKLEKKDNEKIRELEEERLILMQKLYQSQLDALKLEAKGKRRQTQLISLAADTVQKHTKNSTEVIRSLQKQLERVRNELKTFTNDKDLLQKGTAVSEPMGECSKSLETIGNIMESELQCTICAELFISAVTLNCSHSFCKYCITMWKEKKKDCPICRTRIKSECQSLVLDSLIERMVENLSSEMKKNRLEVLNARLDLSKSIKDTSRRRIRLRTTTISEGMIMGQPHRPQPHRPQPNRNSNASNSNSGDRRGYVAGRDGAYNGGFPLQALQPLRRLTRRNRT